MKRGRILSLLVLISLLILTTSITANAATNLSEQEAYDWLIGRADAEGSFNDQVFDTALAMLALNALGDSFSVDKSMSWLEAEKNTAQTCWPKSGCKVKDTAMALLVLNAIGSDLKSDTEDWLVNAQTASLKSGDWLIGIVTGSTGVCKFTYTINKILKTKDVKVNNGYFPECGNSTFLDLNDCLGTSGLIDSNPALLLTVDCSALGGTPITTLLYRTGDSYYILETVSSPTADIRVNNGCYGKTFGGACDVESSLYANWALNELKSDTNTILYLKENVDNSNVVHNAIMSLITGDKKYANALKSLVKTDGSWNKKAFDTAWAVYALSKDGTFQNEVQNGITWLKDHQKADGSWDSDVKSTAMVFYGVFPQADVELRPSTEPSCTDAIENQDERGVDCGGVCENVTGDDCCNNNVKDEGEEGIDCGGVCSACEEAVEVCNNDGSCDYYDGETVESCPDDCNPDLCINGVQDSENYEEGVDCGGACGIKCPTTDTCNYDGICDSKENAVNCPDDCCGDGYCDDDYESSVNCPEDCGEKEVEGCKTDEDCEAGKECKNGECVTAEEACTADEDCEEEYSCVEGNCVLEEGTKFPWVIIAIVVLLLALGGFLFYKKFLSPPKKKEEGGLGGFGEEGGGEGLFGGLPSKPK